MLSFNDYDSLQTFLIDDRDNSSFSPIRFINVESLEMWIKVKKLLQSMVSSNMLLSEFCEGEDTTPNIKRLNSRLKKQTQNLCVYPISEYLRIMPDKAKNIILDLLFNEYQDSTTNHYKIYIPMYRMKSVFQSLDLNDPRKENCILLLETGEEGNYSLTIIQKNLQVDFGENSISGFKHYLEYWEQNPEKPLTLHTENAIYFEQNLFFDNVRVIVTSYDLLKFHCSLPNEFLKENGTREQWDFLAERMAKESDFVETCCSIYAINCYDTKLFKNWNKYDEKRKWLLWMWSRIQTDSSYLTVCAKKAQNVDEFVDNLFNEIITLLNSKNYDTIYKERKELLQNMNLPVPDSFICKISTYSPIERLKLLTDLTNKERECIFSLIKNLDYSSHITIINILRKTYPLLANYLSCENNLTADVFSNLHKQYFDEYRWNKVTDNLPSSFYNQVVDIAKQDGESVFNLKARNEIVSGEYIEPNSTIIFVDGMGAEYIDLIAYVLSEIDDSKYSISYQIGSCILPTTTEYNKNFLEGKKIALETLELDELKHGAKYYPDNIVSELDFIASLKEKVLDAFSDGVTRVILASDHGTSRLAVLARKSSFDNKIPTEGHSVYKYGRYCEGTDIPLETAIEYDGKLIFADYSRFEQKGAPIDEIHGGASLEEWLVPIVTIQKQGSALDDTKNHKTKVKVCLISDNVQISNITHTILVKFKVEDISITSLSVFVHKKSITCKKIGDSFQFEYEPVNNEKVLNVELDSDTVEGKFVVNINHGIGVNKTFDI